MGEGDRPAVAQCGCRCPCHDAPAPAAEPAVRLALSPAEVAEELGLNVRTVQRLMQTGAMPHVVISKSIRKVTRAQLERYLADLEQLERPDTAGAPG